MIGSNTSVCCLIGDPVGHSLSPLVHNTGFKTLGLDFVFVAFRVRDIRRAIEGIRGLGIRGASVTIPHKVSAMGYIDEVDGVARDIGAINTIVNDGSRLRGFNFDYSAALTALEEKTAIKGKRAVLLGAGGTALTVAVALKKAGAELIILNRTREKAEELARRVGAEGYGGLDGLKTIASADILVNATPVGMSPRIEEAIVPKEVLHPKLTVFDVVYNPRETRLIARAREAGCTIVYGYRMFLYQAVVQFELFTGHKAPVAEMERALVSALEGGGNATSADRR